MVESKGGYILRNQGHYHHGPQTNRDLEELGIRQLFDEGSNSFSYLIWDKSTEEAVIVDPVRDQSARDLVVATNLHLLYAINTHVHEDHISGASTLKKKIKGLKSIISRGSGAAADEYIDDGDEIHFGNRHITALATPGHTSSCMSFMLDDGKAVLTGDTLLVGTCGQVLENGSAWSLCDSLFHKLFTLPGDCVVLPGHDFGGGVHSTIGAEMKHLVGECGSTMEDFIDYVKHEQHAQRFPAPKDTNITVACNVKDGAKPFHLRSLRTGPKQRWGIFG